jgi:hypothetical protein
MRTVRRQNSIRPLGPTQVFSGVRPLMFFHREALAESQENTHRNRGQTQL